MKILIALSLLAVSYAWAGPADNWGYVKQAPLCADGDTAEQAQENLNAKLFKNAEYVTIEVKGGYRKVPSPVKISSLSHSSSAASLGGGYGGKEWKASICVLVTSELNKFAH